MSQSPPFVSTSAIAEEENKRTSTTIDHVLTLAIEHVNEACKKREKSNTIFADSLILHTPGGRLDIRFLTRNKIILSSSIFVAPNSVKCGNGELIFSIGEFGSEALGNWLRAELDLFRRIRATDSILEALSPFPKSGTPPSSVNSASTVERT